MNQNIFVSNISVKVTRRTLVFVNLYSFFWVRGLC